MLLSIVVNQHISKYERYNANNAHCNSNKMWPPIPHSQYNTGQYQHCRYRETIQQLANEHRNFLSLFWTFVWQDLSRTFYMHLLGPFMSITLYTKM